MICGSGESKDGLAAAAGAEPSGQMRDKKMQAAVAQSACQSQNAQKASASEHFRKLRCPKVHALWREAHFQVTIPVRLPIQFDFERLSYLNWQVLGVK